MQLLMSKYQILRMSIDWFQSDMTNFNNTELNQIETEAKEIIKYINTLKKKVKNHVRIL